MQEEKDKSILNNLPFYFLIGVIGLGIASVVVYLIYSFIFE